MMKIAFALLAILGIVLGTVNLITPADAATYYYQFAPPTQNGAG
jgi:hypothetical protein